MSKNYLLVKNSVICDDCKFSTRSYADGYILKDFTRYEGDVSSLPTEPDQSKFWTYIECSFNTKKLLYLNISGEGCPKFKRKK